MIDNVVRIRDLSQGLALVTLLPAPLLASRRLFTRTGFFSPSLDGGLPLFELFNPSRRSSSAIRAFSDAFSALSALFSAISSSPNGSLSSSRIIRFLNRKPLPPSREIYRQFTSRSPNLGSNPRLDASCRVRLPRIASRKALEVDHVPPLKGLRNAHQQNLSAHRARHGL